MAVRKSVRLDRGPRRQPVPAGSTTPQAGSAARTGQGNALGQGCGVVIAILLVLLLIGKCTSNPARISANSTEAAVSQPAYVAARSLKCRREPDPSAVIAEGLARDDQVVVAERRGNWARLTRKGGDCWVSGSFLADAPSGGNAAATGSTRSGAQGLLSSGAAPGVAAAGAGYAVGKVARQGRSHAGSKRRSGPRSRRGSDGGYRGSGCPCSGSQVCIGPRGGRYCITRGGNKRYGV